MKFELTRETRLRALTHGEAGAYWIAHLDDTVAALAAEWGLQITRSRQGGSESLVLDVERSDGRSAVLKIGLPGSGDLDKEAAVLNAAGGNGYAQLYAYQPAHRALLLERLGPAIATRNYPIAVQLELICNTLVNAWTTATSEHFMSGAEKADWLAHFIETTWVELSAPCDRAIIDLALAYAAERTQAHDPQRCVLVHGDAHEHNTLLLPTNAAESLPRCKFIDPDGLWAEPAYDLGVLMRGWSDELLAGDPVQLGHARRDLLAAKTGIDPIAIWQWGFIERVSTGLHLLQLNIRDEGLATLAVAEHFARA